MAIWFVRTDGTDSLAGVANGRDALGLSLLNASYDHTGGAVERQLTAAAGTPFSGVSVGEQIYLLNAVGGVADGLYTIEAVQSSTVIGLEADAGLTADSTADVDSSDGPFATLGFAIYSGGSGNSNLANGDDIRVCNNATHSYTTQIDLSTTVGTEIAPITVTGATALGVVDGTRATISFSGQTSGSGFENPSSASNSFFRFQHLRITACDDHGFYLRNGSSLFEFYNCRIDNCGQTGMTPQGSFYQGHTLIYCEIDNNGADFNDYGVGSTTSGVAGFACYFCSIHDNTGGGVSQGSRPANGAVLYGCLIYGNGGPGVFVTRGSSLVGGVFGQIINCTIHNNSGNGIDFYSSGTPTAVMVVNTVIADNTGVGIDTNGTDVRLFKMHNLLLYNNSVGDFDASLEFADFPNAYNNVSGSDPLFTDETDDAEDYEPQSSSPLIGAGYPGVMLAGGTGHMDIGALQREMAAGGGGGMILNPGMTGGIRG